MHLEHSFTVPVGMDDAWAVLLDIERVAPCMPGAKLDTVDGDEFTGTVKVKLGPISLTYKGKASFVEKDEAAHRAVISAHGRDARGNGTASARVIATLSDDNGATKVDVVTELDITGRPAQFGRGVMVDVGNKLIGQFADCLAEKLTGPSEASEPAAPPPAAAPPEPMTATGTSTAAAVTSAAPEALVASAPAPDNAVAAAPPSGAPAPAPVADDVEPIDLLQSAGPAVAKRLAPVIAALVVLLVIVSRLRKR